MYIFLTIHKLAKILFEPLFFVALAGMLWALWRHWKRRDWRFYLLAGGIIFMLLWRSGIAMMSKRYIEIMLFPGLAFAAYFIYKFPLGLYCWLRPWWRRHGKSRRQVQTLSSGLLIVLLVFLGAKLCRYNRFDRTIISGCAAINQEQTAYPHARIYEHGLGATRVRYYTKKAVTELPETQELAAVAREIPDFFAEKVDVVYLCCKEPQTRPQLPELVAVPARFTVQRIFSAPLSNRKKHYWNIYRLKRN